MLKAVQCSTKLEGKGGYWESCEGLIDKYGKCNMPALPKKDEKCLLCNRSFCQHMLHTFIINIPYQNDITWWLKEIERREKTSEKSEKFEKLLPIKIRSQMADKGSEAGLFSGVCVLVFVYVHRRCDCVFLFRENLIGFVCVCVCLCVCVCVCAFYACIERVCVRWRVRVLCVCV